MHVLYKSSNVQAKTTKQTYSTLECTLHSRVKDFTTDNSFIIFPSNSKGRLILYVNVCYDATIFCSAVVLSYLEFDFKYFVDNY